jgi:hypothetical protein
MKKPTPNPPEANTATDTDPTSPYASIDTKKLHEAAERALDYYLNPVAHIMAKPYTPQPDVFRQSQSRYRIPAGQCQRVIVLGYGHAR